MLPTFFPLNQPEQSYRIKRIVLAFEFYVLCCAVMFFCAWQNLFPWSALAVYTAGFVCVCTVFYAVVRSGLNLRFKDPNIAEPQMACAILLCAYSSVHAGPFRGLFMFAYIVALMFGGSRLRKGQLVRMTLLAMLLFPLVEFAAYRLYPDSFDWRMEFVNWIGLNIILTFAAMLVHNMTRLSVRLRKSNAELQVAMDRLTDLATHDELTGLYNRRYLAELLAREKSRTDRHSADAFCVCMFDIDYFKRVNDSHGHAGGDSVLQGFATLASRLIRNVDVLARWGGEEFLLLLPHTSSNAAQLCAERIRAAVEQASFDGMPADFRVTVSIGIAQYHGGPVDQLVNRADHAMYNAKNTGRNRIVLAPENNVRYAARP